MRAARHRARRGRGGDGCLGAVRLCFVFGTHDLVFGEQWRSELQLEGALLANPLVSLRRRLHLLGLDVHDLLDRQLLKQLRGRDALLRLRGTTLVAHRLRGPRALFRHRLQLPQLEEQLLVSHHHLRIGLFHPPRLPPPASPAYEASGRPLTARYQMLGRIRWT